MRRTVFQGLLTAAVLLLIGVTSADAASNAPGALQPVRLVMHGAPLWVMVWPRGTRVLPATGTLRSVPDWLRETGAVAAINGGFFNHSDGGPVSHVRVDGQLRDDPARNQALMRNSQLRHALSTILHGRSAWFLGTNGWGIAPWRALPGDAQHALQAGPALLPQPALEAEAFRLRRADGSWRDGIQSQSRAKRSALGLRGDGSVMWLVAGNPGLTIGQLAQVMQRLTCVSALALDGGSSACLAWRGPDRQIHWGPENKKGPARVRSVLLALPPGEP